METPETAQTETTPDSAFEATRIALEQAMRVITAALALLRAELRLARSSALVLIGLGFALIFLGVGAWLATSAAIAAAIYQLTGNVFYGVGAVAAANIIGAAGVLHAMRGCWRDLSMPRTRRMLGRVGSNAR